MEPIKWEQSTLENSGLGLLQSPFLKKEAWKAKESESAGRGERSRSTRMWLPGNLCIFIVNLSSSSELCKFQASMQDLALGIVIGKQNPRQQQLVSLSAAAVKNDTIQT